MRIETTSPLFPGDAAFEALESEAKVPLQSVVLKRKPVDGDVKPVNSHSLAMSGWGPSIGAEQSLIRTNRPLIRFHSCSQPVVASVDARTDCIPTRSYD